MSEEDKTMETGETTEPTEPTANGIERRDFVAYSAAGAVAMFGVGGIAFVSSPELVRPPGAQNTKQFQSCIRCEKCMEVCPHKAISMAHVEDGFANIRTPKMDFKNGFCDFCEDYGYIPQCANVCPVGSIQLSSDKVGSFEAGDKTIIGKAIITRNWCLAWNALNCKKCYDSCTHEAIILDENNLPYVVADKCNGCGICEYVCLSKTAGSLTGDRANASDRAIVVRTEATVAAMASDAERGWA